MNAFKTLAEARGAYDTLAAELADSQQKVTKIGELEAQLAESKAFGSTTATENENFRLLIVQKDEEISGFKTKINSHLEEISRLKNQVEMLEKSKKTAKVHARELVAASGGAPIAVDQAEINRMQAGDEKEFVSKMAKCQDSAELNRLYREYNKIFRPNGKHKKN